MARLYLVRHGQTYFEPERRIKGQLDVRLTPKGRRQAQAAAAYLSAVRADAVYASTLYRTREGAGMIADSTGAPLLVSPLIDERHWGLWQGLTADQTADERATGRAGADGFGPLGEHADDFAVRARLFSELMAERRGQTVIAVTHGGILKNLVLPTLGLDLSDRSAFTQDTGAISLLAHDGGDWRPIFLNLTPARAAAEHPLGAA